MTAASLRGLFQHPIYFLRPARFTLSSLLSLAIIRPSDLDTPACVHHLIQTRSNRQFHPHVGAPRAAVSAVSMADVGNSYTSHPETATRDLRHPISADLCSQIGHTWSKQLPDTEAHMRQESPVGLAL